MGARLHRLPRRAIPPSSAPGTRRSTASTSRSCPTATSRTPRRARSPKARPRGRRWGCPRGRSCSAASTTTTRSRPRFRGVDADSSPPFPAACCGCWKATRAASHEPAPRGPGAASTPSGWCSPRASTLAHHLARHGAPTSSSTPSLQRPHDGERRAVGGPAGRHRPRREPRSPGSRGREPAATRSGLPELVAGTEGGLRGARASARSRARRVSSPLRARLAANRATHPLVRHGEAYTQAPGGRLR